jgi:WD40 repeat protein/tRNA A-37 threonylcarbamoyl transferase component Bud32
MSSPDPAPQHPIAGRPIDPSTRPRSWGTGHAPSPPIPATPSPPPTEVDNRPTPPGSTANDPAAAGLPAVPGYLVLEQVGEGGMGVVYKARQTRLNRVVALKLVLGRHADPKEWARFRAEAVAMAAVRHPNVAQVFEAGEHDRRPFLAMEYLPGGTLSRRLADDRPDPRAAAALLARVARGVAAAHDQGIVHRDLKPANILFDEHGEPKVTDFGLAKRAASDLTATQAVMGTPAYMAPEQACGKAKFVGPAADVWALGVVLYECLTGTRPFRSPDTDVLLCLIREDSPVPPRRRAPAVPRDLERVCLKCLEKDPADRYPTANELADELTRFLDGEPVLVRPAGPVERAYKWARRKPTQAAAVALVLFSLTVTAVGATIAVLWRDAVRERKGAESARDTAEGLKGEAERARADVLRANYFRSVDLAFRAYHEGNVLRARQLLVEAGPDHHGWEWDFIRRRVYSEAAESPVEEGGENMFVNRFTYTPDGRYVLAAVDTSSPPQFFCRVKVWDAATGQLVRTFPPGGESAGQEAPSSYRGKRRVAGDGEDAADSVLVSRDGTRVVATLKPTAPAADAQPPGPRNRGTAERQVRVFDTITGQALCEFRSNRPPTLADAAPDGTHLLVYADGGGPVAMPPPGAESPAPPPHRLFLLDTRSGRTVTEFGLGGKPITDAVLVLGGKQVWAVEAGETIRAWDAASGRPRPLELPPVQQEKAFPPQPALAVGPTRDRAVAIFKDGTAGLIDLETGRMSRLAASGVPPTPSGVTAAARDKKAKPAPLTLGLYSPDGSRVTIWAKPENRWETAVATAYDTRTGQAVATTLIPGAGPGAGWDRQAESPAGRWVATSPPGSHHVTLTDTGSGRRRLLKIGPGMQTHLTFSPGGQRVAITRDGSWVKVWEVDRADSLELGGPIPGRPLGYSRDGTRFLSERPPPSDGPRSGSIVTFDTRTGSQDPTSAGDPAGSRYAFTRGGKVFVHAVREGVVTIRETGSDRDVDSVRLPDGVLNRTIDPIWCPDGRWFLTTGDGVLRRWDPNSGREVWRCDLGIKAIGTTMTVNELLQTPSGSMHVPVQRTVLTADVSVSPNGAVIAVRGVLRPATHTGTVLLDAATGTELHTLPADAVAARFVFSPDSSRLAVTLGDRLPVFDVRTGRQLFQVQTAGAEIRAAAFLPDGSRLATGGFGGNLTLWDTRDGREVCHIPGDGRSITDLFFHPDGSQIAVCYSTGAPVLYTAR